ncbi:hypothetical protein H5410_047782 [Solanum commersonii]|uniref:Uncharacterized protein n=1 Tax=Solanum commersonii TaxID=4109 RepID=A0A9J5XJA1_SOLCO|nr:hypothetical protein H5410_047782 [Solanum commersonii]
MVDNMTEARLRWFEHVKRKCANAPVMRTCERLNIVGTRRGRGRPKKYREKLLLVSCFVSIVIFPFHSTVYTLIKDP